MSVLQVMTLYGRLEGFEGNNLCIFRDIRFAKSPVGEFRWRPPQNPERREGFKLRADFCVVCTQETFPLK